MVLIGVVLLVLFAQYTTSRHVDDIEDRVSTFIDSRIEVAPADVLREVRQLRDDVKFRTNDRFYRSEFELFLEANPDLKPPIGWKP